MKVPTIDERFADFLNCPAPDRWLAVRERLLAQSDFDPYAPEWRQLEGLFAAGSFARLLQFSERLGRLGCLSPRFHFWQGVAAREMGDASRANWEKRCTRMCLEAILESGHGTASAPFLSTYPWDCYDVLRGLDVQPRGQRLVNRDHLWCDVVTVAEGDEYWFDVTELLGRNRCTTVAQDLQRAYLTAGRPF
jgi:hypothetical protein